MTLLELHKGTLFSCPEDILALAAGGSPCLGILSLMGILPPTSIHYDFLYFSCAFAVIFPFYARKALFFFFIFKLELLISVFSLVSLTEQFPGSLCGVSLLGKGCLERQQNHSTMRDALTAVALEWGSWCHFRMYS